MTELRILVCVKRVPAPGARITLTADRQSIDSKNLGFATSPHEECAVEGAIQLVEMHGGSATVLTLGAAEADEQLRYAVSVGINAAVHVTHAGLTDGTDFGSAARSVPIEVYTMDSSTPGSVGCVRSSIEKIPSSARSAGCR